MPDSKVSQVPIFTPPSSQRSANESSGPIDLIDVTAEERWHSCRISADVAIALGISVDDLTHGKGTYMVRISVTEADVNVLFNPGYLEFLGKSDSFVVSGLTSGSHRVEIHPNSGPGAKDGGVFKLFGGGNPFTGALIPTNARVTLWRDELSIEGTEELEHASSGSNRRTSGARISDAQAGFDQPIKGNRVRWLMALPMLWLPLL